MEGVQATAAPGAVPAAAAAPVGQTQPAGLQAQHAAQPAAASAVPAAANAPPLAAMNALASVGVVPGMPQNNPAAAAAAAAVAGAAAVAPARIAVAPQQPPPGHPIIPDEPYIIDHNYVDYAAIPPSIVLKDYTEPTNTGGISQPFPQRLHALLSNPALYDSSVIGWQEHGRCFVIRQPKEFAATTMVTHFKHRQFTSFQRQLNLYGFKRLTRGPDKGAYYHGEFECSSWLLLMAEYMFHACFCM